LNGSGLSFTFAPNLGEAAYVISMASVDQAVSLIRERAAARLMPVETVSLPDAVGRRLASAAVARVSQPPADVSAMDGYAVRLTDAQPPARLKLIGEARAGGPYMGPAVGPGEAVRIFTGAHVPAGADHILIQEDAKREDGAVMVTAGQAPPSNIRRAGLDFREGDVLAPAGTRLAAGGLALLAAGNIAAVAVRRRPRIGILATGDELAPAGSQLSPGQVVNSIAPALLAQLVRWGAEPVDLGLARDEEEKVRRRIAPSLDVVVSIGGASVGDYDVVRAAFAASGFSPVFEKVAMKPGKPTWFSESPSALALGLPGNPAAAMVTARLFLKPLIEALTGAPPPTDEFAAFAETALPAAGGREEYLRAILTIGTDGRARVRPAANQDSSLLSPFLTANALIRRPARAAAAAPGDLVPVLDY
jgi:molybdopterin molybdotransferase